MSIKKMKITITKKQRRKMLEGVINRITIDEVITLVIVFSKSNSFDIEKVLGGMTSNQWRHCLLEILLDKLI
jgi:hypothetical protein